jgi:tRNA-dihydrouridine synthase B
VANGDIDSAAKAREVLALTGADALMIGRAALGRPWLFGEIAHVLAHGTLPAPPRVREVQRWLTAQLHEHLALYGERTGVRSARKHIGWVVRGLPGGEDFRRAVNAMDSGQAQLRAVSDFFDDLADRHEALPAAANDGASRRAA